MERMEKLQYLEPEEPPSYNVATAYDSASAPEEGPLIDQSARLRSVQPAPLEELPSPAAQASLTERPTVGRNPTLTLCPQCGIQVTTHIDYVVGWKTYLASFFLAFFGCICCSCLPYCMDICKRANHYCPRCGIFVYSYNGF